jgi:hypothetical protein
MAESPGTWCPRCLRPTGNALRCPACGLLQAGTPVDRLRHIAVRLSDIGGRQAELATEDQALRREQAGLFVTLDGGAFRPVHPVRPAQSFSGFEWRWEVVRDLLLWLGAVLVGVAALIFAAVAWGRLSDGGRALMLFGATLAAGAAAAGSRRRLPATAEALSGLTVVLLLVDWYVLRRAGLDGWSPEAWWAAGAAMAAAVSGVASRWFPVQRLFCAALAQAATLLALDQFAPTLASAGVGLCVAAALATGFGAPRLADPAWRGAAGILVGGSLVMVLIAGGVAVSFLPPGDVAAAVEPAAVFVAMGLVPAGARLTLRTAPSSVIPDGLVAAAGAGILAAAATIIEAVWGGPARFGPIAVLGLVAFTAGRSFPQPLQRGTQAAAGATMVVAVTGVVDGILAGFGAPLRWLEAPWSATADLNATSGIGAWLHLEVGFGTTVLVLLAVGMAAAVCLAPLPGGRGVERGPASVVAAMAATGVVAVLPLAAGWPLWGACLVTGGVGACALVAGAWADRGGMAGPAPPALTGPLGPGRAGHALTLVAAGSVLVVTASGWAGASEPVTLAWVPLLAMASVVAALTARPGVLRVGFMGLATTAVLMAATVTAAGTTGDVAVCGFVLVAAAGALVAAGAHSTMDRAVGDTVEVVAGFGAAAGAMLAAAAPVEPWLALGLTAAVACLVLAGLAPGRHWHLWIAGWVAVGAAWAWLVVARVTVVEAYTVPAAVAALVSGGVAQRRVRQLTSWATWMPGLVVGILPTLVLAVADGGLTRRLTVTAAGFAVVVAGARAQRQAPLVVGAVTLLTMAVDALVPVATELPRWATIGGIGLILLWLGATAERRAETLRRLRRRFDDMEPEGWSPFVRAYRPPGMGGSHRV